MKIIASIVISCFLTVTVYAQCGDPFILINGNAQLVAGDGVSAKGLTLPFWLDAGSTLAADDEVNEISVIEFNISPATGGNNLVFNRVLLVSSQQTVPAGTAWKVNSIFKVPNATLPAPTAGSNSPVCVGDDITLTASSSASGVIYSWTGPNGFTASTQNPSVNSVSLSAAGAYSVRIVDGNGCESDASTTNVVVNILPTVNAGSDIDLCNGSSAQLNASGASTYSWSPSAGLSASNVSNPTTSATNTTNYTVTGTDANGCEDTDEVAVTVNPVPDATFSFSPTNVTVGESITFTPNNTTGPNYSWTFQGGNPGTSSQQSPTVTWAANGNVTVSLSVTDANGCSFTETQTITVVQGYDNGVGGNYAGSTSNTKQQNALLACESVYGAGNCTNTLCGSCNNKGYVATSGSNCGGATVWNYYNTDDQMSCGWPNNQTLRSNDGVNWFN